MKVHAASLVLSIVAVVFAILLPIVTYPCGVIALVLCVKNRETHNMIPPLIISIIALVIALVNSCAGAILMSGIFANLQ